jgi:hypothetical protein
MTALTPSSGALGRPVARGPRAVLLAGEDDERDAGLLVGLGRVVDRRLLATGEEVAGEATLDAVEQEVLQADVGEGAADHHLVVAATRAVGVEVLAVDAVLGQVLAGRAVGLDRTGRADVVGRHRVAELGQHAGTGDVGDRRRLHLHAVEVRGLAHVGRVGVPGEGVALGGRQRLPALVTGEDVGVVLGEQLRVDRRRDDGLDLLGAGQMSARKTSLPSSS